MTNEFLAELRKEFLNDTLLLLERWIESVNSVEDLVSTELDLTSFALALQSLRGAGNALGFHELADFALTLESLLSILRVHPQFVRSDTFELVEESGRQLKQQIETISHNPEATGQLASLQTRVEDLIRRLEPDRELVGSDLQPSKTVTTQQMTETLTQNLAQMARLKASSTSVKVDIHRIDSVMDLVGELVVIKSQLLQNPILAESSNAELSGILSLLDKTVRDLQDKALGMRMTSMKPLFQRVQRVIRDLSLRLSKPVEIILDGEDTEIDRNMIEQMTDPLTHMARNALDHGMESQADRLQSGKPSAGKIKLSAKQSAGRVVIEISDDGRGLSRTRILEKAKSKGLISPDQDLGQISDNSAFQFIFREGFTTSENVNDVSGRGLGMAVVKENIEKLNGNIEIQSVDGQGTVFRITLPLTTAITEGMLILICGQKYIVPLNNIRELIQLPTKKTTTLSNGQSVVRVRDSLLPLLDISHLNRRKLDPNKVQPQLYVVVETVQGPFALKVDAVLGQTQVVLKPLGEHLSSDNGTSGAAILGDGKIALLMDLDGLVSRLNSGSPVQPKHEAVAA